MTNRFTSVATATRQLARAATGLAGSRVTARSVLTTAQHTLTVFGVSALVMIAVLFARPDLAQALSKSLLPEPAAVATVTAPPLHELMEAPAGGIASATASDASLTAEEKAIMGTRKQQEWVTSWLSKRYRVAGDATNMLVSTAYLTAREIKLDPLLILAVMAIESGLNPFAESPMGAQGLMQVMSKIHHEKFQDMGGVQAALNPVANIRVGSLILKDYVTRGGSVEAGLKTYVGAAAFETDDGYGSRVLAEYKRLKQVSAGKKVPTYTPVMAAAPAPGKQVEAAVAANTAQVTAAAKLPDAQLAGL
ncbi:lytic transglycosylase domain-containing protein [Massilia sp. Root351]|jgi:soluble lytic murein transglycosylase-like protein|uniref:lytic transglycosylase domain-containing protein n=1 Tax=Massilia sp. Root351 TaxID=1736522 RepID=UPI0009E89BA9|nr:lytic transglycosylase domain-containing protein [Massilia sp. Root351]